MPDLNILVTVLAGLLFTVVMGLLGYGFRNFREKTPPSDALAGSEGRQVNPALEVFWTGCAAVLLLAIFAIAR